MQTLCQLRQVVNCFEMELAGIKFHDQRKWKCSYKEEYLPSQPLC